MRAKAISSNTPNPTPTNHEDKLVLMRQAGEALAEVKSFDELCGLVDEFRRGFRKLPKDAPFAPVQLVFERRRNTIESRPEPAPAAQRVSRQTGGQLVRIGEIIPAALAEIEASTTREPQPELIGGET